MQLLIFNEEYLVGACHQRASITSLPFVHTARRSYRLNDPVRPPDWCDAAGSPAAMHREAVRTLSFRGRRSRNKVSVGEPAEGSLPNDFSKSTHCVPEGWSVSSWGWLSLFAGVEGLELENSSLSRFARAAPIPCCLMHPFHVLRHGQPTKNTTPAKGYLGSRNDEERSKMRYVM